MRMGAPQLNWVLGPEPAIPLPQPPPHDPLQLCAPDWGGHPYLSVGDLLIYDVRAECGSQIDRQHALLEGGGRGYRVGRLSMTYVPSVGPRLIVSTPCYERQGVTKGLQRDYRGVQGSLST